MNISIESIINNKSIINNFNKYKKYIQNTLFMTPQSIHGVLHAKRVLLLICAIAYINKLEQQDTNILCISAIYHDIGRTHDFSDTLHGIKSVDKINELKLLNRFKLSEHDINHITNNVILHCVDDFVIDVFAQRYGIKFDTEYQYKMLGYLKDADNLDRVRLGDLDISYLRNESSKELVHVAQFLLNSME